MRRSGGYVMSHGDLSVPNGEGSGLAMPKAIGDIDAAWLTAAGDTDPPAPDPPDPPEAADAAPAPTAAVRSMVRAARRPEVTNMSERCTG